MTEDRHADLAIHARILDEQGHLPSRGAALRGTVIGVVVVLALLAAGGWAAMERRTVQAKVLAAVRDAQAKSYVSVAKPKPAKEVQPLTLPGTLQGFIESPVYARSTGYVTKWHFDLGARVKEGDLLASIEAPEVEQQYAQTQAQRQQIVAQLELARTTLERWVALRAKDVVAQQELDEKRAQVNQLEASLASATAETGRLKQLLGFNRVLAPFSGVITKRMVDVGDLVSAGSPKALFNLAKTDKLRLYVNVPQNYAPGISIGQRVKILRSELIDDVREGRIVRTAQAIDPQTRTLQVEVEVPNPKGDLLAGSYVEVRVPVGSVPSLVVPVSTLLFRPEGVMVALVREGKVALRTVRIGRDLGTTIEILSGVGESDALIINPADSIAEGDAVEVRAAADAVTPGKPGSEGGKPAGEKKS
jgi:RND family efflux transporter MFP subunit